MAKVFYDILTRDGEIFYTNHANLLLVSTADKDYFTDEGGSFSGTGVYSVSLDGLVESLQLSLGRLVLATMPSGSTVVVGGLGDYVGGTYTAGTSFDKQPFTILGYSLDGEAVQFRGVGIVSFSASAGPRSNSDKYGPGADRLITVSVKGGADSYGFVARGAYLIIKGDAAANITVSSSNVQEGLDQQRLNTEQYFYSYSASGIMTAAYRAAKDLFIMKDLTGTLTCKAESNSVYISDQPSSWTPSATHSSFWAVGNYVYGNGFGANAIAAENITVSGEMNSFASITTSVKDYDVTFYYTRNSSSPHQASIQSVGISAVGEVKFGNVSGGTISTTLSNASALFNAFQTAGRTNPWFGKGSEKFTRARLQSIGVKANHIIVNGDFAPESITVNADNISGNNCNVAGMFASNQLDVTQKAVIGGRIDVTGDLAGKIDITVDSVNVGSQYGFSVDFCSRQWAAGIAAESATWDKVYEMFEEWDEPARTSYTAAYYKSDYEYGVIRASGKISPEISIDVKNSGSGGSYFYAYGLRAAVIEADDISPDVNIKIDANSKAMGIGIFVRDGARTHDGTPGQNVVGGNITITGSGVGVMGFGTSAMNLQIKGTIDAECAVVSGIVDKAGRVMGTDIPDNCKVTKFKDGDIYYLFGQNDVLELASGAKVKGKIDLGDGQNIITIDSNATLIGMIDSTLGTLQNKFRLNGKALDNAMVTLTGACSLTESVGSITVDVDSAVAGTYKLIDTSAIGTDFGGQRIAVTFDGQGYQVTVNGGALKLSDDLSVRADFAGTMLTFTVVGDTGHEARKITGVASDVDVRNAQITVSWDKFTSGSSYVLDYKIMEDDMVVSSGTKDAAGNEYTFTGLAANQRVTGTISVKNGDGSETADFESESVSKITVCNIIAMSQARLFGTEEKDLLYSLDWSNDAQNTLPISHYEIQYIDNSYVSGGAPDWTSSDAVTKYSTDTSLIISGLRDNSGFWWRARAVDINGNAGEWSRSKYFNTGNDNTAPTIDLTRVASGSSFDIDTGRISAWIEWPLAEDDSAGVESYQLDVENVFGEKFEFSISILQSELLSGEEVVRNIAEDITVKYKMDRRTGIARCELDLPNGSYNWKVSVADFCGNVNTDFAVGNEKGGNWVGDIVAPEFTAGAKAVSSLMYDEEAKSYYNHVTLSWGRAKDNKGDRAFEKYEVVMSGENNLETVIAVIDDIRVNSYEFDSTQTGNYKFYVRAYDRFGNVSQTDNASFVVDFTPPTGKLTKMSAPVISAQWNDYDVEEFVVATSSLETLSTQKVYTYYVSDVSITLNFTANFVDDLSSVKYQVELSNNEQFISQDKNVTRRFTVDAKTGSNYTLTLDGDSAGTGMAAGLLLGMDKIYYRIRAVDEVGNATIWHDYQASTGEKYFKLQAPFSSDSDDPNKPTGITRITDGRNPSAPSSLKVTVKGATSAFSWKPAQDAFGVEKYQLTVTGKNGAKKTITVNTVDLSVKSGVAALVVSDLAEDVYSWSVTAIDYTGKKSSATGAKFTLDWSAPKFTTTSVSVSGRDAIISWGAAKDNLSGVDHYEIQYWISDNPENVAKVTCDKNATSCRIYHETSGTYRYKIGAVDKSGNTIWLSPRAYTIAERVKTSYKNPRKLTLSGVPASRSLTMPIGGSNYSEYLRVDASGSGVLLWNITSKATQGKNTGVNTVLYDASGKKVASAKVTTKEQNFIQPLVAGTRSNSAYNTLEMKSVNVKNFLNANVSVEREEKLSSPVVAPGKLNYRDTSVGAGDSTDIKAFTINSAANLVLSYSASGATKFTVNQMVAKTDKKGVTTYSLKAYTSISVKAKSVATSKALLLDKGTYYIVVQSTGGNSKYGITVKSTSAFFTKANQANDDNWKTAPTLLAKPLTNEWVGYSDKIDYRAFTVGKNGGFYNFSFTQKVSNNLKLTVYMKSGNNLKQVKTVTAKAKSTASTGDLCLKAGTYYLAVEAPGAAKAQNSSYTVNMASKGTFNHRGNETSGKATWRNATPANITDGLLTTATGGDKIDYFDISRVAAQLKSLEVGQGKLKVSLYDKNNKAVKAAQVKMANGSVKKNVSSLTLVAGDKVTGITLGALVDIKYLKIEAATNKVNTYKLSLIA